MLKRLLEFDDVHAKRATENYFAEFAYRATREPMRWTGIFGEFNGQLAQSHIREWCKEKGKEIAEKYRGSSPDGEDSDETQFSPGSPLMQRLEKEFAEELKRMSDSGAFDAENAAQRTAYVKLALATMGRDDHEIYHGEMS